MLFLSPIRYSARERFRELLRPYDENRRYIILIARGVPVLARKLDSRRDASMQETDGTSPGVTRRRSSAMSA